MTTQKKSAAPNKRRAVKDIEIEESTGNVFADLGLPDAEELLVKAELTRLLCQCIRELKLTQVKAAERLGLKQPDISKLMAGKYTGFSAERLFRFFTALNRDIEIIVRKNRTKREASISVLAA